MSSGEPDGTQRIKAVVQYSSAELHTLAHGQIDTLTLTEEGSENQSEDWESLTDNVDFSDDSDIEETGDYCLKVEITDDPAIYAKIRYELSQTVSWGTFKSISFACHDNREQLTPSMVYLGIETDNGVRAIKLIYGSSLTSPSDSWVTWAISKSGFTTIDGGMVEDSVIKYVIVILANFSHYERNQLWLDTITLTYTGGLLPLTVDSAGNLQINVLGTGDVARDLALEGGNLANIKTAVATPSGGGQGENTDIDQAAEALVGSATPCRAVMVMAEEDNTDTIFVGFSGVTVDTGIPLKGGEFIILSVDDANTIFVIGGADNQACRYIYLE